MLPRPIPTVPSGRGGSSGSGGWRGRHPRGPYAPNPAPRRLAVNVVALHTRLGAGGGVNARHGAFRGSMRAVLRSGRVNRCSRSLQLGGIYYDVEGGEEGHARLLEIVGRDKTGVHPRFYLLRLHEAQFYLVVVRLRYEAFRHDCLCQPEGMDFGFLQWFAGDSVGGLLCLCLLLCCCSLNSFSFLTSCLPNLLPRFLLGYFCRFSFILRLGLFGLGPLGLCLLGLCLLGLLGYFVYKRQL